LDNLVNVFKRWVEKRRTVHKNKELCSRYPFLIPWNRFTGELHIDRSDWGRMKANKLYDWSYTELDAMPQGWRKAFGIQMCDDLLNALIEDDDVDRWRIVQMKEKYGQLRLYDNGHKSGSVIPFIISKYEGISERTCIHCGAPATRITLGWISPYCDKCCPEGNSMPIDEFFEEEKDERNTSN
jgi:ferredoxin